MIKKLEKISSKEKTFIVTELKANQSISEDFSTSFKLLTNPQNSFLQSCDCDECDNCVGCDCDGCYSSG